LEARFAAAPPAARLHPSNPLRFAAGYGFRLWAALSLASKYWGFNFLMIYSKPIPEPGRFWKSFLEFVV
jgi:hypothetical protein